jgi:hypothetical protein
MGLDTKTYWLTDRQPQCDFDFERVSSGGSYELVSSELEEWVQKNF